MAVSADAAELLCSQSGCSLKGFTSIWRFSVGSVFVDIEVLWALKLFLMRVSYKW